MEKQTEFFNFFLLKVKQDEYSQDDILSKLAFSLVSHRSTGYYQMHTPLCHLHASIMRMSIVFSL